jgi:hypothetical protein
MIFWPINYNNSLHNEQNVEDIGSFGQVEMGVGKK